MADHSSIEWTDATWNPITGCSVISPGCTNCYAMKLAGTRMKHTPSREGLTRDSKAGPVWNGQVRLNEEWLDQPIRWRKPRVIFVCAHGDLFHEAVPDDWIDSVFSVMCAARNHTFQVLTKRPARMREYLSRFREPRRATGFITRDGEEPTSYGGKATTIFGVKRWPLPNVWLGVSAEDQLRAEERIPELLDTPAAVRFVSIEPLLGPLKLEQTIRHGRSEWESWNFLTGGWQYADGDHFRCGHKAKLDWIIAGGESGPGARPMHPDWARGLRDQCAKNQVPFFFKQWGDWAPIPADMPSEILESYDVKMKTAPGMVRLGKKAAGRLLDGIEHNGMPQGVLS